MNSHPSSEQGHLAAGVQPGQILLGKYRIERVLGMGGMGVVVAATHVTLEERVAIKFLLPDALSNPEAIARFLREARAAVRIKSEHVARVTDVGQLENGAPYMIMEYLDGADLGSLTVQRGALPIEDAVEFLLQACEALAEAHALGIIHRDLKPANLFLVRRADGTPSVKVLDFGISKLTGLSASGSGRDLGMTKTATIMGSPLYMSPEQMASSRDVDTRTDIWALGAILYELLTGAVPFQADTITQLCALILQQPPPPLRNLRPDAPEPLQAIILRCLEKDRERRYANIAEFASALAPFAPHRARISIERVSRVIESAGLGTSRPPPAALPPGSVAGQTRDAWGNSGVQHRKSGRTLGLVIAALVGFGGIAAAALYFMTRSTGSDSTPSSAAVPPPVAPAPTPSQTSTIEPAPVPVTTSPATSSSASVATSSVAATPASAAPPRQKTSGKPARTAATARTTAPVPPPAPAAPTSKPPPKVDLLDGRK
ncbi:MAG TPA: serine/threonine-protein kinase [Polyangiaceae bacterium]